MATAAKTNSDSHAADRKSTQVLLQEINDLSGQLIIGKFEGTWKVGIEELRHACSALIIADKLGVLHDPRPR